MQIVQIEDNNLKLQIANKVLNSNTWYGVNSIEYIKTKLDDSFFASINHNYTYIAYIALNSNSDETLEISSIAVSNNMKKQKLSFKLIDAAFDVAKAMKKKIIIIKVKNSHFINTLKKKGFFIIENINDDYILAHILGRV